MKCFSVISVRILVGRPWMAQRSPMHSKLFVEIFKPRTNYSSLLLLCMVIRADIMKVPLRCYGITRASATGSMKPIAQRLHLDRNRQERFTQHRWEHSVWHSCSNGCVSSRRSKILCTSFDRFGKPKHNFFTK